MPREFTVLSSTYRRSADVSGQRGSPRLNQPIIITGLRHNDWKSPALSSLYRGQRSEAWSFASCDFHYSRSRLINGPRLMIDIIPTVHRVHASPGTMYSRRRTLSRDVMCCIACNNLSITQQLNLVPAMSVMCMRRVILTWNGGVLNPTTITGGLF